MQLATMHLAMALLVILEHADQIRPAAERVSTEFLISRAALPDDADDPYGEPKQVASLTNRRIDESSGLAASLIHPDVFWTHNDSGDRPRLYAFNRAGKDLGEVTIKGADAIDWEDICSFSDVENGPTLLLADVGDNQARRSKCQLYLINEPKIGKKKAAVRQVIHFRYENGAQDCEAVAVDPATKTIFLVAKRFALTCPVFTLRIPNKAEKAVQIAKPIGRLTLPLATAMDISPDGRRAVVLTYGHAYEYLRRENETWQKAFTRPSLEIKMPARRQGEAICYDAQGRALYLTSEQAGSPFWEVLRRRP